jgi:3-phenylpropionate/cinnamic acid dioxygenase small subunit
LLFATFDPNAPPLGEYLGEAAWYLDVFFDRREGGIEVVGGMHKWIIPCNWKFPAENFSGDSYHVPWSHLSAIRSGFSFGANTKPTAGGRIVSPGNGHAIRAATEIERPAMSEQVIREVERLLFREARLLDERRFHEWLELFTDDVRYWMGMRSNRYPKKSKAIAILDPDRYIDDDLTGEDELAIFDETRETLTRRVAPLDTGMAWAEDPPSRTRRLIANIEIEPGDTASELKVYCSFILYRSRAETEQDFYVGARQDVLRRVHGAWKIARRKLTLDQNVLSAKNVSIFF